MLHLALGRPSTTTTARVFNAMLEFVIAHLIFFNAVDNCGDDDLVHLLLVGSPATTNTVTTCVERSALGHFPHLAFGITGRLMQPLLSIIISLPS